MYEKIIWYLHPYKHYERLKKVDEYIVLSKFYMVKILAIVKEGFKCSRKRKMFLNVLVRRLS